MSLLRAFLAWRWRWMIAYLLIILVFAVLYRSLPSNSFYAPYMKYEPAAASDERRLIHAFEAHIRESLQLSRTVRYSWLIDAPSLHVSEIRSDDGEIIKFRLRAYAYHYTRQHINESEDFDRQVSIALHGRLIVPTAKLLICRGIYAPARSAPAFADEDEIVAQMFHTPDPPCNNFPSLIFTPEEDRLLEDYASGLSGDPSRVSGWFWRLLYFSATTVTTVGFGDIVPLTLPARLLAGAEPVIGWLFAAFLIDSVTRRRPRSRRP